MMNPASKILNQYPRIYQYEVKTILNRGNQRVVSFQIIIIMIKKVHLGNFTPKSRQTSSTKEVQQALQKAFIGNKKVRAQSHFRGGTRKANNISMFEPGDQATVILSPEDKVQLPDKSRSTKQFGTVFGKNKPQVPSANGVSLPPIQSRKQISRKYYMDTLLKSLQSHANSYLLRLYKQHFEQVVRGLHLFRHIKIEPAQKKITLAKSPDKQKTVVLDLDETLVHCSEMLNHCSVKLNIPLENGMSVVAGVNVRPFCKEFLKQVSQLAEVIIFTASNSLYADTVINYIDPQSKFISHRLYRQHCTFQKGLYVKDLRNINRNLQDMVLVDNSSISYSVQPENGIPIIPFYDNNKDRELVALIGYLRELLQEHDVRVRNKEHFMVERWKENDVRSALLRDS